MMDHPFSTPFWEYWFSSQTWVCVMGGPPLNLSHLLEAQSIYTYLIVLVFSAAAWRNRLDWRRDFNVDDEVFQAPEVWSCG